MKMEKDWEFGHTQSCGADCWFYRSPLGPQSKNPATEKWRGFLLKAKNAPSGVLITHFLDNGFRVGHIIGGFAAHHFRFAAGVLGSFSNSFFGL